MNIVKQDDWRSFKASLPSLFLTRFKHVKGAHVWHVCTPRLSTCDKPLGLTVHQRVIDKVIVHVCLLVREPCVTGAFYRTVF